MFLKTMDPNIRYAGRDYDTLCAHWSLPALIFWRMRRRGQILGSNSGQGLCRSMVRLVLLKAGSEDWNPPPTAIRY
jgi:hypothetical protein